MKIGLPLLALSSVALALTLRKRVGRKNRSENIHSKNVTGDPANTPLNRKFGESTRDRVEEASWESFPASDPPAW